jgi:hypothetical protein
LRELTEKELQQRQLAARRHGAYAFIARGAQALDTTDRSRLAELAEYVQTKPGVLGLLQERVVNAIMLCELLENHIVAEMEQGKAITDIAATKCLHHYLNSSQRLINTLIREMKNSEEKIDIGETIARAVNKHEQNKGNNTNGK